MAADPKSDAPKSPADVSEALAAIRALVKAETTARSTSAIDAGASPVVAQDDVLVLTPQMRVDDVAVSKEGEILTDGMADETPPPPPGTSILDEAVLKSVINTIIREELKGEMGERISRNLRQLVRREIAQVMAEQSRGAGGRPS